MAIEGDYHKLGQDDLAAPAKWTKEIPGDIRRHPAETSRVRA